MKTLFVRTVVLGAAAVCCTGLTHAQDTTAQDKMFVAKAAEGGMAEISMSQLALKKSKNDDVKAIAQKMVDHHTKLNSDMMPFATQMGVTPPTKLNPEHQAEAARLKSMSGASFDKEYITAMVGDHHKDLGEFISEKNTTSNADLKSTVTQATQVITTHTQMIDQTAQKMGITTPPMPSDPSSL